jgi:arylsulfatase
MSWNGGMRSTLAFLTFFTWALAVSFPAIAQDNMPNILIIMSDDVGITNVSAYGEGIVGYKTPNIDRISNEGMRFIDYYAEQSCTAGRAAIITGQSPIRTGLLKVGLPGASLGLQKEDPTLAELLKPLGYATGQFGKNHLGDRNEFLPTVHGFDEFFGNLYHLNAEEEPEEDLYPKDPKFRAEFGPRGVLDCKAADTPSDEPAHPRFGPMGRQRCTDTGPLTRKRMQTIDDDFTERTVDFIKRNHDAGKSWMAWFAPSRMHLWTHLRPESQGVTGMGLYADGMMEHDAHVGKLLDTLDELKIADNTIVIYTCDNGPHYNGWPDGGISPFRGEKNTNWEGGYRPGLIRWPGKIKAGGVSTDIVSHVDWVQTLMAAAGQPNIKQKLMKGYKIGDQTYKVHLDGFNLLPWLTGKEEKSPRQEFFYWNDTGQLVGLRRNHWKMVFMEQRSRSWNVWSEPFVPLRLPKVFHLRMDPFERADTDANGYNNWWIRQLYTLVPSQAIVRNFLESFKEHPPRQKPAKFNVDEVLATMAKATNN